MARARQWRWVPLLLAACALAVAPGHAAAAGSTTGTLTAWVKANPLYVTISAPSSVRIGETFVVRATVVNRSASRLRDLSLELLVPGPETLLVLGADARHRGAMRGQSSLWVEWRVRALQGAHGGYVLMARASAIDAGDGIALSAVSGGVLVVVEG